MRKLGRVALGAGMAVAALVALPAAARSPAARFAWFDYRGGDPSDTVPIGPGQYRNPILHGFYSDPSVTRVGDDYYLVTSTFAYFPGIPVFHSRNLVDWTQIGNAISRPDQLDFKRLGLSRGVFAPAITFHAGTFYILNTCVDCGGNYLVTATDPRGPWSRPIWLPTVDGIDASLFFDDDGRSWIVNNGPPPGPPRYDGHRAIWLQEFDAAARRTVGPRTVLVDGGVDPAAQPVWIEGPHLLRHDGRYYLSAAQGGTAEGHSQVVFRADRVAGPYTPDPEPALTQRDLPADRPMPVTSAGHADLVRTAAGDWWATFLAVRPYGDDLYNTGRETFLLPVRWRNGWPVILPPKTPVPYVADRPALPAERPGQPTSGAFHVRTTFAGPQLPLDWVMLRNPRRRWWHTGHGLVLDARPERLGDRANPSFVGRRQQHSNAQAETLMFFDPRRDGDKAGLAVLQDDDHFFFVGMVRANGRTEMHVERRTAPGDPVDGVVVASAPLSPTHGPIRLGIDAAGGRYRFRYATRPGRWRTLAGDADGTILSTKKAGGFVGATIGPYAVSGR